MNSDEINKDKRRPIPLRFGLRFLLIFIVLLAVALAWWRSRFELERDREAAQQLLLAAPHPLGYGYEPAALVRVVNKLHSMGDKEALRALETFAHNYPTESWRQHDKLALIVPLLFMCRNPEDKLPEPVDTLKSCAGVKLTMENWSSQLWPSRVIDDIMVEQGIPFHTVVIDSRPDSQIDLGYLVVWAKEYAKLRDSPLTPSDDPFAAAEAVMLRLAQNEENTRATERMNEHIRYQVYKSVRHLLPYANDEASFGWRDDEEWHRLKKCCKDLGLHWDEVKQMYAAKGVEHDR